jgi:hypothetical protein
MTIAQCLATPDAFGSCFTFADWTNASWGNTAIAFGILYLVIATFSGR